mmetsp:Transcript_50230/g.98471  ORF Transcript_50230/g.98471 Transcript_50230/m.98471 type:complete len:578 (+) Transcript_50230:70-1803(+)
MEDARSDLTKYAVASLGVEQITVSDTSNNIHTKIRELVAESVGSREEGESFAVVNLTKVLERLELWHERFPMIVPVVPVKVNPDPVTLKLFVKAGVEFDIASTVELEQVLKAGAKPEQIHISTTSQLPGHMRYAHRNGLTHSQFDSVGELDKFVKYWPNAELLLRVHVPHNGSVSKTGEKYGCSLEDAPALLQAAKDRSIIVVGTHFHVGCLIDNVDAYLDGLARSRKVFDTGNSMGFKMHVVNIGGGFSIYDGLPMGISKHDFVTRSVKLAEALKTTFPEEGMVFHAEPGTYMNMSATSIVTPVIKVVQAGCVQKAWVSDSIYGALCGVAWAGFGDILRNEMRVLNTEEGPEKKEDGGKQPTIVYGVTCDWEDVILNGVEMPALQEGAVLVWHHAGAYCLPCACDFNGFRFSSMPRKYVVEEPSQYRRDGFRVRYQVKKVPDKGLGLVLKQDVKKGEVIYAFEPDGRTHFVHNEASATAKLAGMKSDQARAFFLNHIFGWRGEMIELIGDCMFMNHDKVSVLEVAPDDRTWIAARDLKAGDEIVDNYSQYENPQWYIDLCKKYEVEWAGLVSERYS